MLGGRRVLALDLGSYSLKLVELDAGLRGVEFRRCEELPLPAQASPEEIEATIELFLQQRGIAADFCVSAIPADRTTQRHLRFPFVGAKRVAQAVRFEVEEGLPVPFEELVLTHEQAATGRERTDVLAVLAPRSEVEQHLARMRRIGVEPRIVEVEGAVLANLSEYLGLRDVGRLVVDVGHHKTNLSLLVDGRPVCLRSIPLAGRAFTEAIALAHGVSVEVAENEKHKHGLFEPGSSKPISPGVRNLLDRLTRECMRTLQSMVGDALDSIAPSEILLVGGSARAPGLAEWFREQTGLTSRTLSLPAGTQGVGALAEVSPPCFAQAAALALRASSTDRVTSLDLRQGPYRYVADLSGLRPQLRLTVALFGLALLLWIAMSATTVIARQRHVDQLRTRIGELHAQTFPDRPVPADPMRALEAELLEARGLADHLGVTETVLSPLDVVREISARVPAELDVSLNELRLERHSVRASGASEDFRSVDKLKQQLQQVPEFAEVILSDVVSEPRRGGFSFSLSIKLREGP
jgi:type IV pilus assembly protein PilM